MHSLPADGHHPSAPGPPVRSLHEEGRAPCRRTPGSSSSTATRTPCTPRRAPWPRWATCRAGPPAATKPSKQPLRGTVGLLLLGVHPPGTGGLDVVRHLRRPERARHIPAVLLTGFARDRQPGAAAYALGVADPVTGPVDPWALRTRSATSTTSIGAGSPWNARSAPRARPGEHLAGPARPALPHPHARAAPGQPAGAHTGELERDRT
ncbi:two-component system response regulator [Streptomyces sp. NPDC016640]|uniref:response regulator n=1 Tax=Streptomyces sp. NPDC016640 TaxID=3364969 RepID=UPI0036F77543